MYESKISTGRWMVYDVLGNAGWIAWIVCLVLLFRRGVDAFTILAALPALVMLIGIAELISERIQKLDWVLPKARLSRGFGALTLGVSRTVAVEFTFFLAIPVMFGASLLKILKYDLAVSGAEFALLAAGMLTAYVVSVLVIRRLLDYIRRHDFKAFGWYRIALGAAVLAFFTLRAAL